MISTFQRVSLFFACFDFVRFTILSSFWPFGGLWLNGTATINMVYGEMTLFVFWNSDTPWNSWDVWFIVDYHVYPLWMHFGLMVFCVLCLHDLFCRHWLLSLQTVSRVKVPSGTGPFVKGTPSYFCDELLLFINCWVYTHCARHVSSVVDAQSIKDCCRYFPF